MNYTALAITVAVVALEWIDRSAVSATVAVAWLSFLMLAKSLFHLAGALAAAALLGALPMLAHGSLIVFRGSRLF